MRLRTLFDEELLKQFPENQHCNLNLEIEELFLDSRKSVKNGLFFCTEGIRSNSHKFIEDAIRNGAVAIAYSDEKSHIFIHPDVEYIKIPKGNQAIWDAVDIFYDSPSKKLDVYAVTGTNGKTSTAYLICKLLGSFEKSAYNGTIGQLIGQHLHTQGHMTTPDNLRLNQIMDRLVRQEVKSFCLEVSSHALDQSRVEHLDVDVAVFTNLTHDHLDYHQTMQNYLEAKLKLFQMLKANSIAIINADDPYREHFVEIAKERCPGHIYTFGEDCNADYRFYDISLFADHTRFKLLHQKQIYEIKTNLLGKLNVYNLCAAIAAIHQKTGRDISSLIRLLSDIDFHIGRLEHISIASEDMQALDPEARSALPDVIVDFAHTPDAFTKVFEFAKEIVTPPHKIFCVFGSAGERDSEKRPVMGKIADQYCDRILLTEDDYRIENSEVIATEIQSGIKDKEKVRFIKHREDAIKIAIESAAAGDCILILGKAKDRFMATDLGDLFYEGDDVLARKYLYKKAKLFY